MRSHHYFFILFLLSCSSSSTTTVETSAETDTVAVVEEEVSTPIETVTTETTSTGDEQVEYDGEISADTAWLSDFARDPLGFSSYQGIVDYLRQENIAFVDSAADGEAYIVVGNSYVSVVINETYGDLICSAYITTPSLPLDDGLFIGMERAKFYKITGVSFYFRPHGC